MEILLSPSISLDDLSKAELIIFDFVKEVSKLYPATILLSELHELLHLVDYCTNCFQFEEINRKLVRFLHGADLIGEELIKIFSTGIYFYLIYHLNYLIFFLFFKYQLKFLVVFQIMY
jgi:hypothetical protein